MSQESPAHLVETQTAASPLRAGAALYSTGLTGQGELENLCVVRGDVVVAKVVGLPFNALVPLGPDVLKSVPAELRRGSGRAVSAKVLAQSRRILLLLCIEAGEIGAASALLQRLLRDSDEQFAKRLGVTPDALESKPSDSRPSSATGRRLWQVAAAEVFGRELPPSVGFPPLLNRAAHKGSVPAQISFEDGRRWLEELSEMP